MRPPNPAEAKYRTRLSASSRWRRHCRFNGLRAEDASARRMRCRLPLQRRSDFSSALRAELMSELGFHLPSMQGGRDAQ